MSRRGTWAAAGAAAVLLALSFYALISWLEQGQLSDVPVYVHYSRLVRGGAVPYRDFTFEYPPAALPALLLPAYLSWSYATSFAVLMGACGAGCIAATASALRAVGAGAIRVWAGLLAIGISPLLLGSLFDTRFDLWPSVLAVAALAATVRRRSVTSGLLLGLGFAAKLWPAVLLPIAVAHLWRRRGPRGAAIVVAAFVVAAAACFLPFAILAPDGLHAMFADQLGRPLQVESLGASLLVAAHHVFGTSLHMVASYGSQNVAGAGVGVVTALTSVADALAVATVWVLFARGEATRERLLVACAATVAGLLAFGKVYSPQFAIWLIPFVPLVRSATARVLFVAALVLTQVYFPQRYWRYAIGFHQAESWVVLARDLCVVALFAVTVLVLARRPQSAYPP